MAHRAQPRPPAPCPRPPPLASSPEASLAQDIRPLPNTLPLFTPELVLDLLNSDAPLKTPPTEVVVEAPPTEQPLPKPPTLAAADSGGEGGRGAPPSPLDGPEEEWGEDNGDGEDQEEPPAPPIGAHPRLWAPTEAAPHPKPNARLSPFRLCPLPPVRPSPSPSSPFPPFPPSPSARRSPRPILLAAGAPREHDRRLEAAARVHRRRRARPDPRG